MAALEGGGCCARACLRTGGIALCGAKYLPMQGDDFVCSTDVYGGTWNLFQNTMSDDGHPLAASSIRAILRISVVPLMRAPVATTARRSLILELRGVSDRRGGGKSGVSWACPLIMDNTAAPVLCQPPKARRGRSDMHSTTKYVGGHGNSIGGVIIDGGNFDWEGHADRFPMLNTPDPSYHGAVWTQAVKPLGPIAYILEERKSRCCGISGPP